MQTLIGIDKVTFFDACEILEMLCEASIKVFLDGGWGVDALVVQETRMHNDDQSVLISTAAVA